MPSAVRTRRCLFAALLASLPLFYLLPDLAVPPAPPPRLAVLVFFDQMRGDYLDRWEKLFGAGRLPPLEKEGAWFQNCHYPYAYTVTAAGHASAGHRLLAGAARHRRQRLVRPRRRRERQLRLVRALRARAAAQKAAGKAEGKPRKGVSPERLLRPTLADALKEATQGKGRVVSPVASRTAPPFCPAAAGPTPATGSTRAAASSSLPPTTATACIRGSADFNKARPADPWFGKNWTRLRPDLDYERYSGPDDAARRGQGVRPGPHVPSSDGRLARQGPVKAYYSAACTPRPSATTCCSGWPSGPSTPSSSAAATRRTCCASASPATTPSATPGAPIRRRCWTSLCAPT